MSKDKREDDVKKIVKEETEPTGHSDAPGPKTGKAGKSRGIPGLVRGYVERPGGLRGFKKVEQALSIWVKIDK